MIHATVHSKELYDYIVVGGGPAGIIAATELAKKFPELQVVLLESGEVSQSSVLKRFGRRISGSGLFEDGDFHLNRFDVPLLWTGLASSQERRNVMGMTNSWSKHHWPIEKTLLGRGLGGCGLHNAMTYVRSLPEDFHRWNSSLWTYEVLERHYNSLEEYADSHIPQPPFWSNRERSNSQRGEKGPIRTEPSGLSVDSVAPRFLEAALHCGESLAVQGFNSPDPRDRIGVGYYDFNIRNGIRDSVANALLGSDADVPENLVVRTGITVSRVLTETRSGEPRSTGVEGMDNTGNLVSFWLHDQLSEVVLTAGAIMTPQLLTNSGIGINGSVADLPGVGRNLQDHPVVSVKYSLSPDLMENVSSTYTVGDELEDYLIAASELSSGDSGGALSDELHDRLGTLGTSGFAAGAFLRSPFARTSSPDIQLTVFPRQTEPHVTTRLSRKQEAYMRSNIMLITVALIDADARYQVFPSSSQEFPETVDWLRAGNRTEARSHVLDSNQSFQGFRLPEIRLPAGVGRYLSPRDVQVLSWGVERVRRIMGTSPMSTAVREEVAPGAHVTGKALNDHVASEATPNSHWVGSTKLGSANDKLSVVSERLAIKGVRGLRVLDSGVIPVAPNGNTHSTVCVVARRGVELMAEDRLSGAS